MKSAKLKSTIRFSVRLVQPEKTESVVLLNLPKNTSAKLPSQNTTIVEGTINGFPFRAALKTDSKGNHFLKLKKNELQSVKTQDTETVEIIQVGDEADARVPMDLQKALAAAPLAQKLWKDITPIARRDWIYWISTAKLKETRRNRIEKACDMLVFGKRRVCCFPGVKWLMKNRITRKTKK